MSDAASVQSESSTSVRQFKSRLLKAKQARRLIEEDSQLLANRIALLKAEEEKARKKIQQTQERANEILRLRTQNETKLMERRRAQQQDALVQKQKQSELMKAKTEDKTGRSRTAKTIEEQRKRDAMKMKRQKVQMKQQMEQQRKEEEERARLIKEKVQRDKEAARLKREEAEKERLRQQREAYEARIQEEEQARLDKEREVERLERVEMQMIERLRKAQMLQQQAYGDLETALSADAGSIMSHSPPQTTRGGGSHRSGPRSAMGDGRDEAHFSAEEHLQAEAEAEARGATGRSS